MLKKTTVSLRFPQGASFYNNPQIDLYLRLMKTIKKMSCFTPDHECDSCRGKEQCRYYHCSGKNFARYPGILCRANWFCPHTFAMHESLAVKFYWIGDCSDYSVLLESIITEMRNKFQKNLFFVEDIQTVPADLSGEIQERTVLRVLTPCSGADYETEVKEMLRYYQAEYGLEFPENDFRLESFQPIPVRYPSVKVSSAVIRVSGTAGNFRLIEGSLPAFLMETGIGTGNCIGGGHIETDYHIEGK